MKLEETFCDFNDEKGVNTVYIVDTVDNLDTVDNVDTVDTLDTVEQSILSLRSPSIFMWTWHGTPDVARPMKLGETIWIELWKSCRVYTVDNQFWSTL